MKLSRRHKQHVNEKSIFKNEVINVNTVNYPDGC